VNQLGLNPTFRQIWWSHFLVSVSFIAEIHIGLANRLNKIFIFHNKISGLYFEGWILDCISYGHIFHISVGRLQIDALVGKKLGVLHWVLFSHLGIRLHAGWRRTKVWCQLILHPSKRHTEWIALLRCSKWERAARRLSLFVALEILEMWVFWPFNFVSCIYTVKRIELIKVTCQIIHAGRTQIECKLLVHGLRFLNWGCLTLRLRYLCRSHRQNRFLFETLAKIFGILIHFDRVISEVNRLR